MDSPKLKLLAFAQTALRESREREREGFLGFVVRGVEKGLKKSGGFGSQN